MKTINFWQKLPKPIIAVAPMDGVTDFAFRVILKQNGADVLYTEFVSADGIYHALDKMKEAMKFNDDQRPIVIQLFGHEPAMFKHAAGVAEKMGVDGVDINFGCPSKRVVQHGSGVKLMTNLDLVRDIVQATIDGVKNIPVSIKIRSGINIKDEHTGEVVGKRTAVEMIEHIKDLDFKAIMMHGRAYEQGLSGPVDTDAIKAIKKIAGNRIVLANGGVKTPEDAKRMLDETGVDGIGIGQGILGRPWLLQQTKDFLNGRSYSDPTWDEIKQIIIQHAQLLFEQKNDHGLLELRKHLGWYIKGFPQASKIRGQLVRVQSLDEVKSILNQI